MRAFLMFSFVLCAFTAYLRGSDSSHIPFLLTSPPASTAGTKETSATVAYSLPARDIKCDVYCCMCKGEKAECSGYGGRKVNYLPRLPAKIRDFQMTSAYLWNLTRSMMANLSNFDIVKMTLTCDNISHIEADAFTDFSKLELLDLSGNPIPMPELYDALRDISSASMTTVALGSMELASLPDDFFDVFFNKTFKKVDLQGNHLKTLNNALFAPFGKVGIIDMSDNELSDVNTSVPITTERLILRGNKFQEFPDLCLRRSPEIQGERGYFRAFIGLQSIHFAENPIEKIHAGVLRGTCLPSLKKLDISESVLLKTLEDNFIADLPVLDNIVVSQMLTLSRYERYAFNSSSLKGLSLERNKVLDKRSVDITHMFSYCPNLEKLSIMNTKLDMKTEEFRELLLPLKSVKGLNLQDLNQNTIPTDLLWRLPKLRKLQYSSSKVNGTSLGRALVSVTDLPQLSVRANGIKVVNEETLPWEFRRNVIWIDLAQNPFNCTCELLWFRRWLDDVIKNKSVTVHNYPSKQYKCRTPASMENVPLNDFHPTAQMCARKDPAPPPSLFPVGFLVGCVLAGLVAVAMVLIYRHRSRIARTVLRLSGRYQYSKIHGEESATHKAEPLI